MLWDQAIGKLWPLHPEGFFSKIDKRSEHHLAAESGGQLAGFIAVSQGEESIGSIFVILVRPDLQGQGVGGRLLEGAMENLREAGVREVKFGQGGPYFWPGVPLNLPGAVRFFEKRGWEKGVITKDMTADLDKVQVPPDIRSRLEGCGARLRLATSKDAHSILEFEKKHFPDWYEVARERVKNGDFASILLASVEGQLVGTNFLTFPDGPHYRAALIWQRLLGGDTGAYGCLGVSEEMRGRYIGYALAIKADQLLRARGSKKNFLGWVFSVEWYERLGYRVWRDYQEMSAKL